MKNWKESAAIETEANPLRNVRGFFCIFLPVADVFLVAFFPFFLINSLPLTWALEFSLWFYLVVLVRKSTWVHMIHLYTSTHSTTPPPIFAR